MTFGRASVSRSDVRRLIGEAREAEVRAREAAERAEAEAEEQRRAGLWGGLPASAIPPGVAPAAAMLQAARDERPRRRSVLDDVLSPDRDGLVFHRVREEDERWTVGGGDG